MNTPKRKRNSRLIKTYLNVFLIFLAFTAFLFAILKFDSHLDKVANPAEEVKALATKNNKTSVSHSSQKNSSLKKEDKPAKATESKKLVKESSPSATEIKKSPPQQEAGRHGSWWKPEALFKEIKRRQRADAGEKVFLSRVIVFLDEQYVAALGSRTQGGKEEVLHIFPCSAGYFDGHTPVGSHSAGVKHVTLWLFDNSVAQYGIQISGSIYFHSLPSYSGEIYSGLKISDINAMGQAASHGCVRLFCMDAKWIYDRLNYGGKIEVRQNRGEEFSDLPAKLYYLRLKEGAPKWDPTDPHKDNPYRDKETFLKWTVKEPWASKFAVVPPVWPGEHDPERDPMQVVAVPEDQIPGPESEPEEKASETVFVGETSPPPLDPDAPKSKPTSPPPLPKVSETMKKEPVETSPPPINYED